MYSMNAHVLLLLLSLSFIDLNSVFLTGFQLHIYTLCSICCWAVCCAHLLLNVIIIILLYKKYIVAYNHNNMTRNVILKLKKAKSNNNVFGGSRHMQWDCNLTTSLINMRGFFLSSFLEQGNLELVWLGQLMVTKKKNR